MLLNNFSNVYFASTIEATDLIDSGVTIPELSIADIPKMTVVSHLISLRGQKMSDLSHKEDTQLGIFYIIKDNQLLTFNQFVRVVEDRPNEKFLIISDEYSRKRDVRVFVETKPNIIKLTFFSLFEGKGHLIPLASLTNKPGTTTWEKTENYSDGSVLFSTSSSAYNNSPEYMFTFPREEREGTYDTQCASFIVLNDPKATSTRGNYYYQNLCLSTDNLINQYLYIPGLTRIKSEFEYNSNINLKLCNEEEATQSLVQRYGISPSTDTYHYYTTDKSKLHIDDVFPPCDLDPYTLERIKSKLIKDLNDNVGCSYHEARGASYSCRSVVYVKHIMAITAPVPGHRRPTYHLIKGVKHGGNIDVVEVARGELIIQKLIPESCYYLTTTGEYCRVSHRVFSYMKNLVSETEIDSLTLNTWIDNQSLHPTLVKAIQEEKLEEKISLNDIQIFNAVKFGALFIEQLIKIGYVQLATALARYITNHADNLNEVCGSLGDILPGANPEGTTLVTTLATTKPCLEIMLSGFEDGTVSQNSRRDLVEYFIQKYKVIKHFVPLGILTKENAKLINSYLKLYDKNPSWVRYYCGTGVNADLLNYPEELKSINKMVDKIQGGNIDDLYNNLRHYQEIVAAYIQFKEYGWNPSDYRIFIEFGLSGTPAEVAQMLQDREHAANEALTIYKNKIEEATRKRVEEQYASRYKALLKFQSTKTLENTNTLFSGYIVTIPTQIYDENLPGSLEKEGKDMGHCVFRSYANSVAAGKYTVVYLRKKSHPEESLVTIGITSEGRINQTYTFHDQSISAEQARAIVEWAKSKKDLVSFKSEGVNVKPGGWNSEVALPNLPPVTQKGGE